MLGLRRLPARPRAMRLGGGAARNPQRELVESSELRSPPLGEPALEAELRGVWVALERLVAMNLEVLQALVVDGVGEPRPLPEPP